jgi:hypothetical protein
MKQDLLIVAFYTYKTPYEEEIQHLKISCEEFGLQYHLQGYENRGAWVHNCAIKPEFILDMLTRFPTKNLLYVDADAVFKQEPVLLYDTDVDLAAYIMKGNNLLSGTIFFRNNDKVRGLVNEWIKKQRQEPNRWDQRTLHETLVNHGPRFDILFRELPSEYCKIFDKDWGDPIIQHNQRSRVYKDKVKESIMEGVPSQVCNQRVTVHGDGSFTIPRKHREAEAYMNKHYKRVGRERRWIKVAHKGKEIQELESVFKGKKCYIIGKGPSLDHLTADAFDDSSAPVIAINEAIHKVESLGLPNPLFVIQQDMGLRDSCKPSKGALLINEQAQHWYSDFLNKYVYDPHDYADGDKQLSVIIAIEIAKGLKTDSFDLICFDGCVNKNTAYAECVGHEPVGDPKRFLRHPKHIEKHIKGYKVNWVIPTSTPSSTSVDKPVMPSKRPVKHHEHDHEESLKSKQDKLD